MELSGNVLQHKVLSSLLWAPLIAHEDRAAWFESLVEVLFAPARSITNLFKVGTGFRNTSGVLSQCLFLFLCHSFSIKNAFCLTAL